MTIANAALTAMIVNTIQGTAPVFDNSGTARDALGYKLGGTVYSERNANLSETNTNYFPEDKTLNDFIVPSVIDLFNTTTDYSDTDIDVASTTTPFTGNIIFTWTDNGGLPVTPSSTPLVSGDICTGSVTKNYDFPLRLTITANVSANSEYGDPKTSTPKPLSKSYKIDTAGFRICNYKTLSSYETGGINAAYYDTGRDFNHSAIKTAGKQFPSMGFVNAVYTLKMSSAQTDYHYKVELNGTTIADTSTNLQATTGVTVNTAGEVKLLSKQSGTVTVTATHKATGAIDSHSFVISKWGTQKGSSVVATTAASNCGGEAYLFKYNEVTSGALPGQPAASSVGSYGGNVYRNLGKLGDEWGKLTDYGLQSMLWFDNSKTITAPDRTNTYTYRLALHNGVLLGYRIYKTVSSLGNPYLAKGYAFCKS